MKHAGIRISDIDINEIESDGPYGMIATSQTNEYDRWYIARKYFDENYAAV